MKLFISILFGSSFSLDVDGSDTISTIKLMIQEKKRSLIPDEYVLMFNGAILEDEKPLSDYKIGEESILQLKFQFNNTTQEIIEEMNRDLDQVKQYREETSSKIKKTTNDFAEICQALKNREEDWNALIDLCVKEMETDHVELNITQEQAEENDTNEPKFVRPSDDYCRSRINTASSGYMSNFGDSSEAFRQQYDPSLTTYSVEEARASNGFLNSLTSFCRSSNDTFLRDDYYAGRCSGNNAANACSSQSYKESTVSAEVHGYYCQSVATKEEDDEKTFIDDGCGGKFAGEFSHVDKTDGLAVAVEKDDIENTLTDNGFGGDLSGVHNTVAQPVAINDLQASYNKCSLAAQIHSPEVGQVVPVDEKSEKTLTDVACDGRASGELLEDASNAEQPIAVHNQNYSDVFSLFNGYGSDESFNANNTVSQEVASSFSKLDISHQVDAVGNELIANDTMFEESAPALPPIQTSYEQADANITNDIIDDKKAHKNSINDFSFDEDYGRDESIARSVSKDAASTTTFQLNTSHQVDAVRDKSIDVDSNDAMLEESIPAFPSIQISPEKTYANKTAELTDKKAPRNSNIDHSFSADYGRDESIVDNDIVFNQVTPTTSHLDISHQMNAVGNDDSYGDNDDAVPEESFNDFPSTQTSPVKIDANRTITLTDSPYFPSTPNERPEIEWLDTPVTRMQCKRSDTAETEKHDNTRRRGKQLKFENFESEDSFVSVENPHDTTFDTPVSVSEYSSTNESSFEGEIPSAAWNSPMIQNIRCYCKGGCRTQSCNCFRRGVNCNYNCHRYVNCHNGFRF